MDSPDEPLGVYEDEESRAVRTAEEESRFWGRFPPWLVDIIPELSLKERILGCATCMICGCKYSQSVFIIVDMKMQC